MVSDQTLQDVRRQLKEYVASFPDIDSLLAEGKLVDKGRGWFEVTDGKTLDGIQRFSAAAPKIVQGKVRIKLRKLKPSLKNRVEQL